MFEPCDLHEDLIPWIEQHPTLGQILRHPLVYSVPFLPVMNKHLNSLYLHKTSQVMEAYGDNNFDTVVWLHERPYRVVFFQAIADELTDADYWRLLGEVWRDSENIREYADIWETLLCSDRLEREAIMSIEDRATLDAMPDEFLVYQGHTMDRDDGWSFTTSRDTAVWFAKRFASTEDSTPVVSQGWVKKADVLAYFSERGESEVLVHPDLFELDRSEAV